MRIYNNFKTILITLILIPLIGSLLLWSSEYFSKIEIFSTEKISNIWAEPFTDSIEIPSGNSKIRSFIHNDSTLSCELILDSGYTYPYAGFSLGRDNESGSINLKHCNTLYIEAYSKNATPYQISLTSHIDNFSKESDPLSNHYNTSSLLMNGEREIKKIPFKFFNTPNWWYEHWKLEPSSFKGKNFFNKIESIDFHTSAFTPLNKPLDLKIYKIYAYYNPTYLYKVLVMITLVLYLLLGLWYLALKFLLRRGALIVPYKQITVENHSDSNLKNIVTFIGENFSDPELTVDSVTTNTGISQSNITKTLRHYFNKDYSHYLKEIRLTEAKRLLEETDLQVTEIAFEVGFNYISSFTRAFKAHYSITPKKIRDEVKSI